MYWIKSFYYNNVNSTGSITYFCRQRIISFISLLQTCNTTTGMMLYAVYIESSRCPRTLCNRLICTLKYSFAVNINTSTHPWYPSSFDWFSWGWSKKIFFQNGRLKIKVFFKIANSQKNFVKISRIGPWVSRIDWWEGHLCGSTYMVERLSDVSSKTGSPT